MTLEDLAEEMRGKKCRWCATPLTPNIHLYDHDCGLEVEGFAQRQWCYVICPKCKYEWAFWKLGIPRLPPSTPAFP